MRLRTLCLLCFLTLIAALPVWSGPPSVQKAACTPVCTSLNACRDFCECSFARCVRQTGCVQLVCDCSMCP